MQVRIVKSIVIFIVILKTAVLSAWAKDYNIDGLQEIRFQFPASNDKLTISGPNGNLLVATGTTGIFTFDNVGIEIDINTAADKGVTVTGNTAINIRTGLLSNLHLISGKVSSNYSDPTDGAILFEQSAAGANNINLDAGTLVTNTAATDGNGIHYTKSNSNVASLSVNNSGTIQVTNHATAVAVYLEDATDKSTLNLTNNSTGVINEEPISGSILSQAVKVTGSNVANITNAGTMRGSITTASGTTSITNSGTIIGAVNMDTGAATIANSGTITGNINLGSNASSTLTTTGNITGDITIGAGQTVSLNAASTTTGNIDGSASGNGVVNTGAGIENIYADIGANNQVASFNVGNTSQARLMGNVSAAAINLNGHLELLNSPGNILVGNLVGDGLAGGAGNLDLKSYSHNINGNISLGAGDILTTDITTPSAAGSIVATGLASISSSTVLRVGMTGGTTAIGSSYTILTGASGSSINKIYGSNIIVAGGSNHYNGFLFTTSVVGDSLLLSVGRDVDPDFAANNNQNNLYNNIANLSTSGALLALQNYLDSGASNSAKSAALDSAAAQVDNSSNRLAFNNVNNIANLVSNRLTNLRQNNAKGSGISSGDKAHNQSGWAEVFGSATSQGNTSASNGYNAQTSGFAMGYDKQIDPQLVVGAGLVYANSRVKGSDDLKHTNINNYQLNLYSGHSFEKFFVNNVIGYGLNNYSSSRVIPVAGVTANARYQGKTYMVRSEIGTNYKVKNDFILTPTFMVTGARNTIGDYSESGANTLNLNVRNSSTNFLEGRVGLLLSKNYLVYKNAITPSVSMSYGYDFIGANQRVTSNFIGQSSTFATSGAKIAQGSLRLGAGLRVYQMNSFTLSADYSFEHRTQYDSHMGSFRAKYSF